MCFLTVSVIFWKKSPLHRSPLIGDNCPLRNARPMSDAQCLVKTKKISRIPSIAEKQQHSTRRHFEVFVFLTSCSLSSQVRARRIDHITSKSDSELLPSFSTLVHFFKPICLRNTSPGDYTKSPFVNGHSCLGLKRAFSYITKGEGEPPAVKHCRVRLPQRFSRSRKRPLPLSKGKLAAVPFIPLRRLAVIIA